MYSDNLEVTCEVSVIYLCWDIGTQVDGQSKCRISDLHQVSELLTAFQLYTNTAHYVQYHLFTCKNRLPCIIVLQVLHSLHWLPVKQRVDCKLATLVYKSLRGQAPSYLVDDCQLITDSGCPQLHLNVPRTNTRLGDRSFSVVGPRIWNSLPTSLRQPDIEFGHFKRLLNSFLFGETAAH